MKKVAHSLSLLLGIGVIGAAFFVPYNTQAQTLLYGQSFELLDLGDLVPQNSWAVSADLSTNPQVVASTSCYAGKCLQFTQGASGSDVIDRSISTTDYFSIFLQLRIDGGFSASAGFSNSVILGLNTSTSSSFTSLRFINQNASEYCLELDAPPGGAYEVSIACGLDVGVNYLLNIVVDARTDSCSIGASLDNGTPVFASSPYCYSDVSSISMRWQSGSPTRWLSVDNMIISGDPQFVSFSTTTAPFESANLDEFCGEIATSTNFIDSIGSSFSNGICRTFAYFFIPSSGSLNDLQITTDALMTRIPFSYANGVIEIYRELETSISSSTTTNFPELYLNTSFSSTTEQWFGDSSILLFSSSTVNYYFPASTREGFRNLMSIILWLGFVAYILLLVNKLINPIDLRN